ncbi:hypothetical protein AQUCO_00700744v1 [Aquilegia coerulea]|uniref:Uncharacterized protein n=1 Tax=Aquilegia coerulea TaxID=218851 RepID=A0A2G5ELI0_AQUCA|nr:hypothetical protein AQUCO_00700744v1 [Aquilegia coerulea]
MGVFGSEEKVGKENVFLESTNSGKADTFFIFWKPLSFFSTLLLDLFSLLPISIRIHGEKTSLLLLYSQQSSSLSSLSLFIVTIEPINSFSPSATLISVNNREEENQSSSSSLFLSLSLLLANLVWG